MEANQKSLQRFTETETKINEILSLKQITVDDIELLDTDGYNGLFRVIAEKINKLSGDEKEAFIERVELILPKSLKNQLWEGNHNSITYAISTLMQELNRMPSKNEIANKAELSRQTIYKHMKDYASHPQYLQQIEQFRFMTSKVLAKVFKFAVNGDMAAAKLYFNVIGNLNGQLSNSTLIQNQNNYIQINGLVLNQETIKRLNPDQLSIIENILKTAIPEAEILNPEIVKK